MAYTANTALITAAMAHAPASSAKSAFVTDLNALQAEIETQVASYSEAEALDIESAILECAVKIANALKDEA